MTEHALKHHLPFRGGLRQGKALGVVVGILLAAVIGILGFGHEDASHQAKLQQLAADWGQPMDCPISNLGTLAGNDANHLAREVSVICPNRPTIKVVMYQANSVRDQTRVWTNARTSEIWIDGDSTHRTVEPALQDDYNDPAFFTAVGMIIALILCYFGGGALSKLYDTNVRRESDPCYRLDVDDPYDDEA